jgi:hypothetical protein
MKDASGDFPDGCIARVAMKLKEPPDWLGPAGTLYTISYCPDCGPEVVWLIDSDGEVQTIDQETLQQFFVPVEPEVRPLRPPAVGE